VADRRRSLLERAGLRAGPADVDHAGISLTSSARVIDLKDRSEGSRLMLKSTRQPWQDEAWTYRDAIGEVRYLEDWLGNAVSRMRLFVGVIVDGIDEPVPLESLLRPDPDADPIPNLPQIPDSLVTAALDALTALGDPAGMLNRATVNLEVPGEFYLVGYVGQDGRERWEARSTDELSRSDHGWLLQDTPGTTSATVGRSTTTDQGGPLLDPETSYVARVWRSHPRWTGWADSPLRAVLDRCEELLLLGRKDRAMSRSRLAAPLLLLPSELDQQPSVDPVSGELVEPEPIELQLQDAMVTPIGDEAAPSAVVPLILKGPGDALQHARTIDLGRQPDKDDEKRAAATLLRILQGLDAPPEVVTGFADVKYANARAIDENSFRYHVEPKVLTLVHALTTAYLRPRLIAAGFGQLLELLQRLVVWYDPAGLVTNPDQGRDAQEVYDAGELSGTALRRSRGFDEQDAPSDEERARRQGTLTPDEPEPDEPAEDLPSGRPAVIPESRDPDADAAAARARVAAVLEAARPRALLAAGSPADDLGRRLLDLDLQLFGRLQAAADAAMSRALERAGARARTRARAAGAALDVPNDRLVAALTAQGVEQLGLTDGDLLDGEPFAQLAARFEAWAAATFEQALRAHARALGLRYFPPGDESPNSIRAEVTAAAGDPVARFSDLGGLDFLSLRERAELDRRQASAALVDRLTRLAAERLYDPSPDPGPVGEADPDLTVPPGVLRAAMARAGGAGSSSSSAGVDDDGRPVMPEQDLPGGVATGPALLEAAAAAGLRATSLRWSHGAAVRPFDPHLALDGTTFESVADERLRKGPEDFPRGATSYFPGDHAGCTCWTEHVYDDPFAGLSREQAQSVRAQQQARDARGRFYA
jgi:hypothetical protein